MKDEFSSILNAAIEQLGITDEDITRQFGISLPSVQRWKAGATAPHPAMQKHVYAWIEKLKNEL